MPEGDVAIKNVADLYLYPNTVRAVKVTGAEVDLPSLQNSVAAIEQARGPEAWISRRARSTLP